MSFHIDAVWAFVSVDPNGEEGVAAAEMDLGHGPFMMPLIAADEARLKNLLPIARDLHAVTGMRMKLIKFATREEIMEIGGVTQ
ncbi:hypothetical protein [Bradyrhizobium diazoefficiens]